MRKHIFNAGPSILPKSVLEFASKSILEFGGTGQSILEISHRGKEFTGIVDESCKMIRELLGLDDSYQILFLQGGASTQFAMVPMNFLKSDKPAGYLNTGTWSKKAIAQAKLFGKVDIVASSQSSNFNYIPKDFPVSSELSYFHTTSNNTIFGTQMKTFPELEGDLICDMSSDIFSCPRPWSRFSLIYAGAQKNLGPAGVTLVVIRNDFLEKRNPDLPAMLDYGIHVSENSLYNTPPVFAIYVCYLTLKWLTDQGGISALHNINVRKAQKLYAEIDRNGLFYGTANLEDRSDMNVTFVMNNPDLESRFLQFVQENDVVGLKGHRSVGGFRASLYNALPEESVDHLIALMQEFERRNG